MIRRPPRGSRSSHTIRPPCSTTNSKLNKASLAKNGDDEAMTVFDLIPGPCAMTNLGWVRSKRRPKQARSGLKA